MRGCYNRAQRPINPCERGLGFYDPRSVCRAALAALAPLVVMQPKDLLKCNADFVGGSLKRSMLTREAASMISTKIFDSIKPSAHSKRFVGSAEPLSTAFAQGFTCVDAVDSKAIASARGAHRGPPPSKLD